MFPTASDAQFFRAFPAAFLHGLKHVQLLNAPSISDTRNVDGDKRNCFDIGLKTVNLVPKPDA